MRGFGPELNSFVQAYGFKQSGCRREDWLSTDCVVRQRVWFEPSRAFFD